MNEIQKEIITNHKMLNAVRFCQDGNTTVEKLKDILGVSRATADRVIKPLLETYLETGEPLVSRTERKFQITDDAALFLGISIGSAHIRATLLGLDLKPIKKDIIESKYGLKISEVYDGFEEDESRGHEGYSFKTPPIDDIIKKTKFEDIRNLVIKIVEPILDKCSSSKKQSSGEPSPFSLMGIGVAVTGPVDYKDKRWLSSPRIDVKNATLEDLLGVKLYETALKNDVFLSIDNNAKAAIVCEYQGLVERGISTDEKQDEYPGDIALLYVGTGIVTASVIDRKLIRGNRNLSGEVGQLRVFEGNTIEEMIKEDNPKGYSDYVPFVLNTITCMTGIDRIILIGHTLTKYEAIIRELKDQRLEYFMETTQTAWTLEKGRYLPNTSAIGAAMEAYLTMCNFDINSNTDDSANDTTPEEKDIVNLAVDISW